MRDAVAEELKGSLRSVEGRHASRFIIADRRAFERGKMSPSVSIAVQRFGSAGPRAVVLSPAGRSEWG
jgi:hypothetical protein